MNNSKLHRLILSGLEKNYKSSIKNKDEKLMLFVSDSLRAIRESGNKNFCNRVEKDIKRAEFFLQNYNWNKKS
jgi:hypothetical protein